MPDAFALALALPGLWAAVAATLVAGLVYGFVGFGGAMIFMPVATAIMPIEQALVAMSIAALSSFVTVLPKAVRHVDLRASVALIGPALVASWAGIGLLATLEVTLLRWAVCAICTVTLAALVSGWRIEAAPTLFRRMAIGGASGIIGGATGLLGPVMVLFQLAGREDAATNRATAVVFLTVVGSALVPLLALKGLMTPQALALGFLLFFPYAAGAQVGQALFQPSRVRLYRVAAYLTITGAILLGLPVWE